VIRSAVQLWLAGLPVEWIRKFMHENAAELYRHPLPEHRLP